MIDVVSRRFGPFLYERVGVVSVLSLFGLPLYQRVDSLRAFLGVRI